MRNFILFFTFLCTVSCEKVTYYPDKQLAYNPTINIAHRGGGTSTIQDNSIISIVHALPLVGGIEVDVQLSKNKTVWLSQINT